MRLLDANLDPVKVIMPKDILEGTAEYNIEGPNTLNISLSRDFANLFVTDTPEGIDSFNIPRYISVPEDEDPEESIFSISSFTITDISVEVESRMKIFDDLANAAIAGPVKGRYSSKDFFDQQFLSPVVDFNTVRLSGTEFYDFDIPYSLGTDFLAQASMQGNSYKYLVNSTKYFPNIRVVPGDFGVDTGLRFHPDSNRILVTVDTQANYDDIVTGVVGYGELNGQHIDIRNLQWSQANGDPIDKPIGQAYMTMPGYKPYGIYNPFEQVYVPKVHVEDYGQELTSTNNLMHRTYRTLREKISRPKVITEAFFISDYSLQLLDVVTIIPRGFQPYLAQVSGFTRDVLSGETSYKTDRFTGKIYFKRSVTDVPKRNRD